MHVRGLNVSIEHLCKSLALIMIIGKKDKNVENLRIKRLINTRFDVQFISNRIICADSDDGNGYFVAKLTISRQIEKWTEKMCLLFH